MLWQAERSSNSVTTLAAFNTLCAACTWQGAEQLALKLLADLLLGYSETEIKTAEQAGELIKVVSDDDTEEKA